MSYSHKLQMGLRNERVSHLADAASIRILNGPTSPRCFRYALQPSRTGRMMPSNKAINEAKSRPVVVALD